MPLKTATSLGMTSQSDFDAGGGTDYSATVQSGIGTGGSAGDPLVIDFENKCWNVGNGLDLPSWTTLRNGFLYFSTATGPPGQNSLPGTGPYDRSRIWNSNKNGTAITDSNISLVNLRVNAHGTGAQQHSNTNGFTCGLLFVGVQNLLIKNVLVSEARTFGACLLNVQNATITASVLQWETSSSNENQDGWHFEGPCSGINFDGCRAINSGDDSFCLHGRFPDPNAGETPSNTTNQTVVWLRWFAQPWLATWHGGMISGTFTNFKADGCAFYFRSCSSTSTAAHPVDSGIQNTTIRNHYVDGLRQDGISMIPWDAQGKGLFSNVTFDTITMKPNAGYVAGFNSGICDLFGKITGTLVAKNITYIGNGNGNVARGIRVRSTTNFTSLDVSGYAYVGGGGDSSNPTTHIDIDGSGGGMPGSIDASSAWIYRAGATGVAATVLKISGGTVNGNVDLRNTFSNHNNPLLNTAGSAVLSLDLSGCEMQAATNLSAFTITGTPPTINSGNSNLLGTGGTNDKYSLTAFSLTGTASIAAGATNAITASATGTGSPPSTAVYRVDQGGYICGSIGQRSGTFQAETNALSSYVTVNATSLVNRTMTANFTFTMTGGGNLLKGFSARSGGTLRNDFGAPVGTKVTISATNVLMQRVGRYKVAGNTNTHNVSIVKGAAPASSTGKIFAIVDTNQAADTDGWVYAHLPAPMPATAAASYYVTTAEVVSGDQWYSDDETATSSISPSGTISASAYYASGFTTNTAGSKAFGPVNFVINDLSATGQTFTADETSVGKGASATLHLHLRGGLTADAIADFTISGGGTITAINPTDNSNPILTITAPSSGNSCVITHVASSLTVTLSMGASVPPIIHAKKLKAA